MTGTAEVREHRAENWDHFLELLYEDCWNPAIGRHRSPYVFRGFSNRDYRLESSLHRFVGDSGRWDLEINLLRDFNKYAQKDLEEPKSVWHLLSIAQHHGLPTRLIDWTYSPLVAAYFATRTSRNGEADGIIWAVDYHAVHDLLPENLQVIRRRQSSDVFDVDVLADVFDVVQSETDPAFANGESGPRSHSRVLDLLSIQTALAAFGRNHPGVFALFFEPPSIDERIVNQSSLFSVLCDPSVPMDEWLARHPETYRKIVVPAELKREFRDKLDQANVNQRLLFPDLDGLTGWLTEYYTQGNSMEPRIRAGTADPRIQSDGGGASDVVPEPGGGPSSRDPGEPG